jgi:hypothetical protein
LNPFKIINSFGDDNYFFVPEDSVTSIFPGISCPETQVKKQNVTLKYFFCLVRSAHPVLPSNSARWYLSKKSGGEDLTSNLNRFCLWHSDELFEASEPPAVSHEP